jgi:hypothetical protein
MPDNIISHCTRDLSQDAASQVIANIKEADFFAVKLDELTDVTGKAQLLEFSMFVCNGDITNNCYFANHSQKQQKAKTFS